MKSRRRQPVLLSLMLQAQAAWQRIFRQGSAQHQRGDETHKLSFLPDQRLNQTSQSLPQSIEHIRVVHVDRRGEAGEPLAYVESDYNDEADLDDVVMHRLAHEMQKSMHIGGGGTAEIEG